MKILGIITEYNPFHNGHLYHLMESKRVTKAHGVIAVMSGNFLQRGEPALLHKWARTLMALRQGVDLLLEIPFAYATRSAEAFAFGAIRMLDSTGIVNVLAFGSEVGDLTPLYFLAQLLLEEAEPFPSLLNKYLKEGFSFPKARNLAILDLLPKKKDQISLILNNPNNILGIEYLKALLFLKSPIEVTTIKRIGRGYHDPTMEGSLASATAIRKALAKGYPLTDLKEAMPESSLEILEDMMDRGHSPIFLEDLAPYLSFLFRRTPKGEMEKILGMQEGLENRIKEALKESISLKDLLSSIKTGRYTLTRIQRILLHLLMGYTTKEAKAFDLEGGPRYLRILGFNQVGQEMLKRMKVKAYLPCVNRVAPFYHQSYGLTKKMLAMDILATDLYTLLYKRPLPVGEDFRHSPVLFKDR